MPWRATACWTKAPLPAFIIEVPKERQNGDYSTNVAMAGAKAFHKAPRVIAQAIVDRLDLADTVFDRAEIAGPGFINFLPGQPVLCRWCWRI